MDKIKNRTKILISTILLGVFLIGAIVTIVLVLAATQQGVQSNITVSYNVEGVAAKVSANYAVVPKTNTIDAIRKTAMTTSGGAQEITFNVSNEPTTETISPTGDIQLDTQKQTVVFEYVFENLAETAFSLTLTERPIGVNMTEKFLVTGVQLDPSEYMDVITSETALTPQAVTYLGQKVYVYIMATVTNENLSASYNGGYNWSLIARETIDITLNDSGTTKTLKVIPSSTVAGIAMPVINEFPTASASQMFMGYYSQQNGQGDLYIDYLGASSHIADVTAETVLYAYMLELYNVDGTTILSLTDDGKLQEVLVVSNQVTAIDSNAFEGAVAKTIIIPSSVTSLGDSAFANNANLESVSFLEEDAEAYSDGGTLTIIPENAFAGCTALKNVELSSGLITIGRRAFYNCSSLEKLVIPGSVTTIEIRALEGCVNIQKLEMPAVFDDGINENTKGAASLSKLFMTAANDTYQEDDESGIIFTYYNCTNNDIPKTLTEIVINGGTTLGADAFTFFSLQKITIGESIEMVNYNAFSTTIYQVKSINGFGVFDSMFLEELTYQNKMIELVEGTSDFQSYFKEDSQYKYFVNGNDKVLVSVKNKNVTSITDLDSDLTIIEGSAFSGCTKLTHVVIPASVQRIAAYSFSGCTSLESVVFENPDGWEMESGYSYDFSNASHNAYRLTTEYDIDNSPAGVANLTMYKSLDYNY